MSAFETISFNYSLECITKEDNDGLLVSNTWLTDCDFSGLFAKRKFIKGDLVCSYTGDIHRTVPALRLKDKSYLMRLGEQCYVDAQPHTQVFARYINDCINPAGWNVNFEKCPEDKCARVVALRDIEVGEEIFADYGKWYWASLKPARMSTAVLEALIEKHCCNNRVDEGKQPEQTV